MNLLKKYNNIFRFYKRKSLVQLVFLVSICLISCKKYPIGPQSTNTDNDTTGKAKGVFIICEGNYNWGNGTLSFYNFFSKSVSNNIFYASNGRPLGDVPQSMTIKDSIGFIIINNSGKIEVINTRTSKSIATIPNLNSPRYMCLISNNKAYVSSLYGNVIYIINPETFQLISTINTGSSTEQMIYYNDKVFAANWSNGNKVLVINTSTNEISNTIITGKEPNSMVLDKNNKLWILCSGGYLHDEQARLMKVDPVTLSAEKIYLFDSNSYPTKLCINASKDTLFYLNKNIYRMNIHDSILPQDILIHDNHRVFYGLSIHKETSQIYISNSVDYVQQGWIYRYSSMGAIIDSFKVDINPGEFCFN